jgi:hypothetical protein
LRFNLGVVPRFHLNAAPVTLQARYCTMDTALDRQAERIRAMTADEWQDAVHVREKGLFDADTSRIEHDRQQRA